MFLFPPLFTTYPKTIHSDAMRHVMGGLLLTLFAGGCRTTAPVVQQPPAPPTPVILTLGNKPFSTDDFFQSFTKNQLSPDSSQRTDVRQYLDLYTNLKLKVLAAESEGRDTTEAFREEMTTYRKQLAQSYLTDKVLIESLAAEAYQRMQEEVNASHILIPLSENAIPADTLVAYQKALALRKQAVAGDDFAQLARDHSGDATTAPNGGNLGYFTAFSVIYPLETAAYTTPVGQVSAPVRTRFGYHLIRVNDRRPSRGKVRVAHILVRMSPGADEAGQKLAQERINVAYARLQKGESFEAVCRDVSDDATSRNNGGVLPWFETGRQVPAFEEAAFALTKPGDVAKPVQTNYGWHLIKLIERRGLEPYSELAPSLQQRVTTDTRADVIRQATSQRLRHLYPVQPNEAVLGSALTKADSSLLRGQWRIPTPPDPALAGKPIVTIASQPYTVDQFFDYVALRQYPQRNPALPAVARPAAGGSPAVAMTRLFERFVDDQLIATEEANLDRKSAEFRALMAEIHDGVLLSQMMEQHVWERSMTDSTGQQQYFEQHQANYQQPERAYATILTAPSDNVLKKISERLSSKPPYALLRSAAPLQYDKNQTALTDRQRETLFDVLVALTRNPGYVVEVSSSQETTERDTVSTGRIRAVVTYLRQHGITLSRISEKDYQGTRPGPKNATTQRSVLFQYFSNDKQDVVNAFNSQQVVPNQPSPDANVTLTEGVFSRGANPYLDRIDGWKTGTSTLRQAGQVVSVQITRVDPARPKTFAEARGAVINDYQALLEQQWLARLRQQYPVRINEDEIRKLVK